MRHDKYSVLILINGSGSPFGCDDPYAELIPLNVPSERSRMIVQSVVPAWGHYFF